MNEYAHSSKTAKIYSFSERICLSRKLVGNSDVNSECHSSTLLKDIAKRNRNLVLFLFAFLRNVKPLLVPVIQYSGIFSETPRRHKPAFLNIHIISNRSNASCNKLYSIKRGKHKRGTSQEPCKAYLRNISNINRRFSEIGYFTDPAVDITNYKIRV